MFGKHLTRLASLRLPGCGITDFDLLGLRPLTGLTLLDLGDATEASTDAMCQLNMGTVSNHVACPDVPTH